MSKTAGRKKGSTKPETEKIQKVTWSIRIRKSAVPIIKKKLQDEQIILSEFAEKAMLNYDGGGK